MTGKIIGTGSYIPNKILDNNELATMVETSDEWIRERTGIISRHIVDDETTSSMACKAAMKAVENAIAGGFIGNADEIDAILVSTMSPDIILPSIACEVQRYIGNTKAFCFDLNAACSGFVFAYNTALSYMNMGIAGNVLIVGSESLSKVVDWSDRGTCILFGDGAGAMLVTSTDENGKVVMHSDGTKADALLCRNGGTMTMDGQQVFRFAVKSVPSCIEELLENMGTDKENIDYFILHQANSRIVEAVAKRLKTDIDKFPMNLQKYGNTSSASIPILLDEMSRDGLLDGGKKIVMSGFGAGLSWGAAYITV